MEKLTMLADTQLVSMYKEGNNEAFDTLLARHQERVFQYISYMLGGNEDAANDVFQETFIKAIMAIRDGRYQDTGQFSAWIMRVARNAVIDSKRSSRSRSTVNEDVLGKDGEVMGDTVGNLSLEEPNAEMRLILDHNLEDLHLMVSRLPETQREVVILRFFQDLSFKEIAELTDCSINTALGRMRYALINLRKMAKTRDLYLAV